MNTHLDQPTVAVVITTYNHAHFLADALESVFAQSRPADEVIVVDDGSVDQPGRVVASFPAAQLLTQANQGLSAARNTGLRAAASDFILFLDADDRLLPDAIRSGLACHARSPGCALVYGGHCYISEAGVPFGSPQYAEIGAEGYTSLLGRNLIGMHATVLYRRDRLLAAGGFDVSLRRCEDYDMYLRLATSSPIASYSGVVAEYRKHGSNMSSDHLAMLRSVLQVQERSARGARDPAILQAWYAGRKTWRDYYTRQLMHQARVNAARPWRALSALMRGLRASPGHVLAASSRTLLRKLARKLPPGTKQKVRQFFRRSPLPGAVRFGDLGGTSPIDENFGYGRGTPIDRYYIERFLDRCRTDIAGRVLEVGDDSYSRRFGGTRITRQDVLHVHAGNEAATIVGDMSQPGVLPEACFDCIVLTQTLHLIYDFQSAVAHLHKALRPGGVLLLTVPGLSQLDRYAWSGTWYWALTPAACARLFGTVFGAEALSVEGHGNVFASTCFLQGLALEEVPKAKLSLHDPAYPLIVTVRAQKAGPDGSVA